MVSFEGDFFPLMIKYKDVNETILLRYFYSHARKKKRTKKKKTKTKEEIERQRIPKVIYLIMLYSL